MKDTKQNTAQDAAQEPVRVVHAYNTPQNIFEGVPVKYRSLFDFDVALIKDRYKDQGVDAPAVTLHKPYFEM